MARGLVRPGLWGLAGVLAGSLWVSPAIAGVPLPSFREELVVSRWYEVNDRIERACKTPQGVQFQCDPDELRAAIRDAEQFQQRLFRDARLEYLQGLGWKLLGDKTRAKQKFQDSLALNPERAESWSDLGDMWMSEGNLDEAEKAYQEVARLHSTGPNAVLGPWRLAEVAAARGDAAGFEKHLRKALEEGFSFRNIEGLPNWQRYYADPRIRDSLEKMVTVYGDASSLKTLEPPPPAPKAPPGE